MRKVALVLAGLLVGAAVSWQVVAAQVADPPLTTLCTRTGADVRAPAANGTCPSGYTRVVIPAPVEPAPTFTPDIGRQLTFTYNFVVTNVDNSTITPFVVRPDGLIVEGAAVSDAVLGTTAAASITILAPVYGTYVVGYHRVDLGTPSLAPVMNIDTVASRTGNVTTLNAVQARPSIAPRAQASTTFAYGPLTIP